MWRNDSPTRLNKIMTHSPLRRGIYATDLRFHQRVRGPDFSTVLRNSWAPPRTINATHKACQTTAIMWGHNCGSCAPLASITIGDDKGKIAAAIAPGELGEPIAVEAKPNMMSCEKVIGIDMICTCRAVDACAPIVRNAAPSSR